MPADLKELAALACNVTGEVLGIDVEQIKGNRRIRAVAEARMVARSVAMWVSGYSVHQIGMAFGAPHHSVLYARHRVEELMAVDRGFAETVWSIRHRVSRAWRLVLATSSPQGGAR